MRDLRATLRGKGLAVSAPERPDTRPYGWLEKVGVRHRLLSAPWTWLSHYPSAGAGWYVASLQHSQRLMRSLARRAPARIAHDQAWRQGHTLRRLPADQVDQRLYQQLTGPLGVLGHGRQSGAGERPHRD